MIELLIRNLNARDVLDADEIASLERLVKRERMVGVDEDIVKEGSRPNESTLLLDGIAARYRVLEDGKRQITALHVPGDFVDLHSFLIKTMDHDVEALTPCTIARMPHANLGRFTEDLPHLTRMLWLLTLIDAAIFREWAAGLGVRNASQRMAHLFCEVYFRLKAVGLTVDNSFSFPISQVDLKDMLGLSAVHTNRTLMDLRQRNLISWEKGVVRITDLDALKEAALFDDDYLHLRHEAR